MYSFLKIWRKNMSKLFLSISILLFIFACGGGGSSAGASPGGASSSGTGYSVPGSFQPVDSE